MKPELDGRMRRTKQFLVPILTMGNFMLDWDLTMVLMLRSGNTTPLLMFGLK